MESSFSTASDIIINNKEIINISLFTVLIEFKVLDWIYSQ